MRHSEGTLEDPRAPTDMCALYVCTKAKAHPYGQKMGYMFLITRISKCPNPPASDPAICTHKYTLLPHAVMTSPMPRRSAGAGIPPT
mmetsp:Transcript_122600/g.212576  ORF Transcript_122600/g.212576 Transcript_122600/m.212576 type:complete len:87 (-) Transcript_122600:2916-3176(-)